MRKKQLLQNPWVVSFIGVGLATISGCKHSGSSPTLREETESVMASISPEQQESSESHESKHEEMSSDPIMVTTASGQTMLVVPEITPSARGCGKNDLKFISTVDMIYWGFTEDQFVFAALGNTVGTPTSYTNQENSQNWGFGFKAGFGLDLPYNGWDIYTNWTRWVNSNTTTVEAGSAILAPVLATQFEGADSAEGVTSALTASSDWKLRYNQIDLELGRLYSISKKLKLRPHIGLEGVSVKQNMNVVYTGIVGDNYTNVDGQNNFKGIGPRVGLHTRWLLGAGFGIYTNVAGSLMWGKTNSHTHNYNVVKTLTLYDSRVGIKPQAQVLLGLDWARCFKGKYFLRFGAAYEAQAWWNQLNMPTRSTSDKSGDLSSQGLTVNLRFEY